MGRSAVRVSSSALLGRQTPNHPSAWKGNSPNFALRGFGEVPNSKIRRWGVRRPHPGAIVCSTAWRQKEVLRVSGGRGRRAHARGRVRKRGRNFEPRAVHAWAAQGGNGPEPRGGRGGPGCGGGR